MYTIDLILSWSLIKLILESYFVFWMRALINKKAINNYLVLYTTHNINNHNIFPCLFHLLHLKFHLYVIILKLPFSPFNFNLLKTYNLHLCCFRRGSMIQIQLQLKLSPKSLLLQLHLSWETLTNTINPWSSTLIYTLYVCLYY